MTAKLVVTARVLPDGRAFTVKGRDAWALLEIEHGLAIETRHESHRGTFPGTHARYVLLSAVEIVHSSDGPERAAA